MRALQVSSKRRDTANAYCLGKERNEAGAAFGGKPIDLKRLPFDVRLPDKTIAFCVSLRMEGIYKCLRQTLSID